ncbi:MAG: MG2 domain-containing protein [Burkholderiales bacterium]|nr:MG2 domain-containing protein [Burkholderiales bacterium]
MNAPARLIRPAALLVSLLAGAWLLPASAQSPEPLGIHAQAEASLQVEVRPAPNDNNILEYQVFTLSFHRPPTEASLRKNTWCEISNIEEKVEIQIVRGAERARALKAAELQDKPQNVTLRCAHRFPFKSEVVLKNEAGVMWQGAASGGQGASAQDDAGGRGFEFKYAVQSQSGWGVNCERENANADCIPIRPIVVRFDRELTDAEKAGVTLTSTAGKRYQAYPSKNAEDPMYHDPSREIVFTKLPPSTRFEVNIPATVRARLQHAQPLQIRTADYPPLVKFAGRFGIVERNAGALLPVTLRNLEPYLNPAPAQPATPATTTTPGTLAKLRQIHVSSDDDLVAWSQKFDRFFNFSDGGGDPDDQYFDPDNKQQKDLRARSLLMKEPNVAVNTLPKPLGAKEFEVVGIPLAKPGLHIVEVESKKLGQSLIADKSPMFVQAAALTTNLAAHFKLGADNALVWVTTLDAAKPVANANANIRECKGKVLWSGKTNSDGVAMVDKPLPKPAWGCPYYVIARSGDDVTFTRSDWTRGIETWRFNLYQTDVVTRTLIHTVFDRTLLRPGETVSMKHVARMESSQGFGFIAVDKLAKVAVLEHMGSGEKRNLTLKWDARGVAESTWPIPGSAKQGQYQVLIGGVVAGSFRVGEFRIPLMRGEVNFPAGPFVNAKAVEADVSLQYLSGGGAKGETVKVRSRVLPRVLAFEGYDEYVFGTADWNQTSWQLKEGDDGSSSGGGVDWRRPRAQGRDTIDLGEKDVKLDDSGHARVKLDGWIVAGDKSRAALEGPRTLVSEIEYADPNGEIQTASSRTTLWDAALQVGIRMDSWAKVKDTFSFRLVVVDLNGKPVANRKVEVDTLLKVRYSHRRRTVGGYYAWDHREEVKPLKAKCAGKSDKLGMLECSLTVEEGGNVLLRASVLDDKGNLAVSAREIWVAGLDEWWFSQDNHDRMDLLPEKKKYEAGETARFQVRMPFREATALVTTERMGVLAYKVVQLSGASPMVEMPVQGSFAPNIYVSVLAVRGRVGDPKATALVDLAKPAFKLGIAEISVGAGQYALKVQVEPDKKVYQTRDKAKVKIRVRKLDGSIPKDAEVALTAVDEGLLELMPNRSWRILDAMMQRRGYGVETSSAQMQVIGRRHFGRKAFPAGGGGGKGPTREVFDTLLKWQARVMLDANGEATVEVPLNDSITSFRIAAVATAGAALFGDGGASIQATKDLIVQSGLPPVVREGDEFFARFNVRNASERAFKAGVKVVAMSGQTKVFASEPQSLELKAGEARDVGWMVKVPRDIPNLVWRFEADESGVPAGKKAASDDIRITQKVAPAVPVRVVAAEYQPVQGRLSREYSLPQGALAGRGGIRVAVSPTIAADSSPVKEYMASYPFFCLEQRTSKAVATRDEKLWKIIHDSLHTYLDGDGLARYYPGDGEGYVQLTAYVLSASHEAGFTIPADVKQQMEAGLARAVEGQLQRRYEYLKDSQYGLLMRLNALEALSRSGKVRQNQLDTIKPELAKWPVAALLDWINILKRSKDVKNRDALLQAADAELRSRIATLGGPQLFKNLDGEDRWWMMWSGDVVTVRAILTTLDMPGWEKDVPRIVRSALLRQKNGHWNLTTANVWGVLALDKFTAKYGKGNTTGKTTVRAGSLARTVDWAKQDGDEIELPWGTGAQSVTVSHDGAGEPWVALIQRAAIPTPGKVEKGFTVTKTITPVEQKVKGQWSRGDVARITITFKGAQDQGWVVVDDPIPSGATILGGGLKNDSVLAAQPGDRAWWDRPRYIERTHEAYRAYYEWLWMNARQVQYTVRLNNEGTFNLPRTRVEAMYAPDAYGELGNAVWVVKP